MNKPDGLILASLPSSGSDWVADCMADARPELRYSREFFCPTVNYYYSQELGVVLGDTLYSNVPNLCRSTSRLVLGNLLNSTWRKTQFNFTKENYLPFQIELFAETFEVVVLIRRFKDTFPPRRHRVMQWYEHFHGALCHHGLIRKSFTGRTPQDHAAIGHYFFARKLLESAKTIGARILWHHELLTGSAEQLGGDSFAKQIIRTRQKIERPSGLYHDIWKPALNLYRELEERFGPIA